MADRTSIEWTDHSFNVWEGCAPVSPGCRFCYARRDSKRWNATDLWRRKGPRKFRSEEYWRKPARWNRAASRAGRRARVFCASMADVFEAHPVLEVNARMDTARSRLWELIEQTPWLDWQLLTKRPENVAGMVPWGSAGWPTNLWLGTSVEDQRRADERIPVLLALPAAVRFLSCEPLLGHVDLQAHLYPTRCSSGCGCRLADDPADWPFDSGIHWVIVGGESGPTARPMHPWWVEDLRHQATNWGVPFLFKQWGQWRPATAVDLDTTRARHVDHDGHTHKHPAGPHPQPMVKVGKHAAGRVLDGRTWDEFPVAADGSRVVGGVA